MEKRLYRSKHDQKLAGVCGGIAEYFEIDSTIVRLLWLVSVFALGTGVLIYIIAALIIPEKENGGSTINLNKDSDRVYKQESKTYSRSFDEDKNTKLIAYSLIGVGALLFIKRFPLFHWINFRLLFPLILIGAGVLVLGKGFKK